MKHVFFCNVQFGDVSDAVRLLVMCGSLVLCGIGPMMAFEQEVVLEGVPRAVSSYK